MSTTARYPQKRPHPYYKADHRGGMAADGCTKNGVKRPRSAAAPASQTALQLLRQQRADEKIPLSFLPLSAGGWTLEPGVHELSGPAGAGKTQLALSMCLQAAELPAPSKQNESSSSIRAIYLSLRSNNNLSSAAHRLQQMCSGREELLQRIWMRICVNTDQVREVLQTELQQKVPNPGQVRLLVLDSVADLLRGNEMTVQKRSSMLFQWAARLQQLASQHGWVCLVLNQATASANGPSCWRPALGLAWSHCLTSRTTLDRTQQSGRRTLTLQHSPVHATPLRTHNLVLGQTGFLVERIVKEEEASGRR